MRPSGTPRGALVVTLCGLALLSAKAAGQAIYTPDRTIVRIGGGPGSRYEREYGQPVFCGLDNEQDWPCESLGSRSLRTIGTLQEIPQTRSTEDDAPEQGSGAARYKICRERRCLELAPVEEVREAFASYFPFWLWREVEVVGAFGAGERVGGATGAFRIWEATLLPEPSSRPESRNSSLEPLVRSPDVWAGRSVSVVGGFRGANLFEDLPADSRRGASDWVLKDGPFSVWVAGKRPRGEGFSLDSASKADCRYRLRVEGTVETRNGFVYVRAKTVTLLGRLPAEESVAER